VWVLSHLDPRQKTKNLHQKQLEDSCDPEGEHRMSTPSSTLKRKALTVLNPRPMRVGALECFLLPLRR